MSLRGYGSAATIGAESTQRSGWTPGAERTLEPILVQEPSEVHEELEDAVAQRWPESSEQNREGVAGLGPDISCQPAPWQARSSMSSWN